MGKIEFTPAGNKQYFTRTEVKASIMQAGYGQREKGTRSQLSDDMGEKYSDELYDVFVEAVEDVVPGFYSVMESINNLWNPDWEEVSWTMPDGVEVKCKPTNSKWLNFKLFDKYEIKAKVSGVEKEESALILFVGIIHSCDAYIARQMIELQNYDLITIHDDFRQLPNHGKQSKLRYNQILANINDSNLLTDILSQILGEEVNPIVGNLKSEDILKSRYSLS